MADFPSLVKDAAEKFKNQTVAYAQVKSEGDRPKVLMQSLEIARQFEGEVTYGRDPKGILFYDDEQVFQIPDAEFKYWKHGSGHLVTIEIKFYTRGEDTPYASFISRVSPSQLPHLDHGEGSGKWTDFQTGSSQARVLRAFSKRINLVFSAFRRAASFSSKTMARVDTWGTLLFLDYKKLETSVHGKKCLVKIASDVFVFYLDGEPNNIVALFIPVGPVETGNPEPYIEAVTWEDYDSVTSASDRLIAEAGVAETV